MDVEVIKEQLHEYINTADEQHLSAIYLLIEDKLPDHIKIGNKQEVNNNELEQQFIALAEKWKDETGVYSTTYQKVINDSYLDIIALGREVVPFILKDMEHGQGHWHTALKALTRDNPVPETDLNKSTKIREAWLNWGRNKNLI
ncbi:MAG: hypothetical protein H7257_08315 [Taibaiella sp.]|nr:hypothetical protein [Taibaiella sp.]